MTIRTTYLGLGAMGGALAAAALDAGQPAVVWNRTPGRAQARALHEQGATIAASVEAAIRGDGVIIVCLLDCSSVHAVLDPVTASLAGRTVINLTTTTPNQARHLAAWAVRHDITYLDGAIMAVPVMIGRPEAAVLYSGAEEAYTANRPLLDLWGRSDYYGTDAGMASLRDMAMLVGMYTMIAGFLHGAAMVGAHAVPAVSFADQQAPFLAAMTGRLAGYAATVDAADYAGPGQQSLHFTEAALDALVTASLEENVRVDVLRPVLDLVRRQIAAGHGQLGTARIVEELRETR